MTIIAREVRKFELDETAQRVENERKRTEQVKEKHEKRKLTQENLAWKPIYFNNHYERWLGENGIYCLLLKEVNGYVNGTRISIEYQREEIEPLHRMLEAPIEQYILFEKDYEMIDGKLSFSNPKETE